MEKTIVWLENNNLKYDEIIFTENKKNNIEKYILENHEINFIVDDAPEQINKMLFIQGNIPIIVPEKRYNIQFLTTNEHYKNLIGVKDLKFATNMIKILSLN